MEIDAVVAWVDGSDPKHEAKRLRFGQKEATPPSANASKARRFSDNDEIRYCLRSLHNHAPWLRTIWLVTDDQFPPSIDREIAADNRVRVVDHREIFRGLTGLLPTFNSLAIETMLWRIKGLAPRFLYFNDDMFLTRPVGPEAFFQGKKVVLRGKWIGLTDMDAAAPHALHRLNAARMTGHTAERHFANKHVIYPLTTKVMRDLYTEFLPEFVRNAAFRFRRNDQFWPIALHTHRLIDLGRADLRDGSDLVHMSVANCRRLDADQLRERLDQLLSPTTIAGCLNYAEAVTDKVPDALDWIDKATGPAAPFERPREDEEA